MPGAPSVETSLGRADSGVNPKHSLEFTLARLNGQNRGVSAEFSASQLSGFKRLGLERALAHAVGLKYVSKEFAAKRYRELNP